MKENHTTLQREKKKMTLKLVIRKVRQPVLKTIDLFTDLFCILGSSVFCLVFCINFLSPSPFLHTTGGVRVNIGDL